MKEFNEFAEGLEVVAEFIGSVWADKKVNLEDLDDLVSLGMKMDKLKEAFSGLGEMPEELKSMEKEELLLVISKIWSVGAAYEKGRKGE